jgi:hypothetical protein
MCNRRKNVQIVARKTKPGVIRTSEPEAAQPGGKEDL